MMGLKTLFTQTIAVLLLAVLLLGAEHAQAEAAERYSYLKQPSEAKEDRGKTKRFWVRYEDHDACLRSIQAVSSLANHGTSGRMKVEYDFPHTNSVVISASENGIQALMSDPNVKDVTEDPKRYLDTHARRELLEWQGQATSYGLNLVQAKEAWMAGLMGAGVTVCVIDTGFDITHEDFNSANYTGESLSSTNEWSNDFQGHGTHVTGIIAAADNEFGLVGVAPEANIHTVQIFDEFGFVYASAVVEAVINCRDAGANIISMSIGGPGELPEERDIFTALYTDHSILSIASSGNSGFGDYSFPASYSNVLSVGAIDQLKNLAFFSTYNDMVDLVAPGVDIWSTLPMNFDCDICQELASTQYVSLDGTSQASPHVAGAAALLFSYNISADVSHIHNALLASAQDLGVAGRDDFYGQGLVKTRDALDVLIATLNGDEPLQDWSNPLESGEESMPTCSDSEMLVTVNLLTDRYGNETSWEIVRDVDDFTVMAAAGFGSQKASSTSYCLPPNCYTFQIHDSFGDGISGEYGNGKFDVTVDDELILSGGNFTFSENVTFGGDCVALSTSSKPDLPPFVDLTLVLHTDDYPAETNVWLEDLSSGEIFWEDEQFTLQATEYTLIQEIDPTSCYSFLITDAAGDGLCCFFGRGSFDLLNDGVVVFSGDDFGASASYLIGEACENQI